jgi:hypothetical protein
MVKMPIRDIRFRVMVEPEVDSVPVRVVDAVASSLVPADVEPTPRCVTNTVVDVDP